MKDGVEQEVLPRELLREQFGLKLESRKGRKLKIHGYAKYDFLVEN